MIRALRPHQQFALDALRSSLAGGKRRPMLAMPTGGGKTLLAAAIVEGVLRREKRVVFVVPALSLIDQTVTAFWNEGIRGVGVIQGDHIDTDWSRPVQVASVQTLQRRGYPDADVVIIDEAHRWFKSYATWMADPAWQNKPFIGLSATPWTKGLGKHFDDLIIAATPQRLINEGYLSPFRVFAPSHPDLTGVGTVGGDYHEGQLAEAMNKAPLVADIVETWLKRGEDRPTLCFAVDRAHAKALEAKFQAAGVPTAYIDAYTKPIDREVIRRRFHAGDVRVVCNIGTLTTGVDWDVRCLILARPTKSEMLFVQIVGRGLRTAEGKQDCLILDHSDTHLRLGFATDIHHDALDDGDGVRRAGCKSSEALPKECPKCTYLRPPKMSLCPACGFKPERVSKIECDDGDLIELRGRKTKAARFEKEALFGQLRVYARRKGYSDGWASNQFKGLFGVWPNAVRHCPDREPTPEVLSWIKSRQIAYAKARSA
jgi:superfamily II DNA or RNA helicase